MAQGKKFTSSATGLAPSAPPVAVLSVNRIDAVMGSIIQLDGRKSYDPSGNRLKWQWRFIAKPLGSAVSSFKDIRPNSSAVSFVPDKTGIYIVELSVSNGSTSSFPVTSVVSIQLSRVPCGENIIPEASFLWDYLSDFWNLVSDKSKIDSVWSSSVQVIGSELIKLWTAELDGSLNTIQSTRQRRWQKFSSVVDLLPYTDARIIVGKNDSGHEGYSGEPLADPVEGFSSTFYVPRGSPGEIVRTDFTNLLGNYGPKGRVIVIGGDCYTISRVASVDSLLSTKLDAATSSNTISSAGSDFEEAGAQLQDLVTIHTGIDAGTYRVIEVLSPTSLRVENLDGSTVSFTGSSGVKYSLFRPFSVVTTSSSDIPNGLINSSWRIPNLLHIPTKDLESDGVRTGDVLVFEVTRNDIGLSAELRAQVVGVDGYRVGFEFSLDDLQEGVSAYSRELFRSLVLDLKICPPESPDALVSFEAEKLIGYFPISVNLATRPFSPFKITVRPKYVIKNRVLVGDSSLRSVPALQETPKDPPVVLRENLDYIVESGNIEFLEGTFTLKDPSPPTWWAECAFYDNDQFVENNYGRLVGLYKDDFYKIFPSASYLSAVKGLFYAYVTGPTVSNIRLGLQILLGLPFTEDRCRILEVVDNFSTDPSGTPIGRILVEVLDEKDRRTGLRKFYTYPASVGVETNPNTGVPYRPGDYVDPYSPLSKGVSVTDYVKDPYWWQRSLQGLEILKYFTFYVDISSEVFQVEAAPLLVEFLNKIKKVYTRFLASVLLELSDDIEVDDTVGGGYSFSLYDSDWGLEPSKKTSDDNHQGVVLWSTDEVPFATRTKALIKTAETYEDLSYVMVSTVDPFDSSLVRGRSSPVGKTIIEGDLLVILPRQPGSYQNGYGVYEIKDVVDDNHLRLLSTAPLGKRDSMGFAALTSSIFPYGSGLKCSIIRRLVSPAIQGDDLVTTSTDNVVTSASAGFISNAVGPGDLLIIESGANQGDYLIESLVSFSPGPPQVPPSISETQVRLVTPDGSIPTLTDLSGQSYRVIYQKTRPITVSGARSIFVPGTGMTLSVLDSVYGTPRDVFTPGMVGGKVSVANSDRPINNGIFFINSYASPGVVVINSASTLSDSAAQSVVYL